ncbi:MAG: chemotaxis protein CheW [Myxococcota bacterium]
MAESARQYLTLGVSGQVFAAPVEQVSEIIDLQPIAATPGGPPCLLGRVDLRREVVPVIDLRCALGLAPPPDDAHTRIVVVVASQGEGSRRVGVKTDRVYEVTALDDGSVEAAAPGTLGWHHEAVTGVGRRRGELLTLVDFMGIVEGVPSQSAAPED